jgi:hypothetical protein
VSKSLPGGLFGTFAGGFPENIREKNPVVISLAPSDVNLAPTLRHL